MYNFSYFKEKDRQLILDFIEDNPFAFLTGSNLSGKQVATQIPVLFEERNGDLFLQGHMELYECSCKRTDEFYVIR
jgi:transcriptional regulator